MRSGLSPWKTFPGAQYRRRLPCCSKTSLSHPPTPVSGYRSLDHSALVVPQRPRRQEAPAGNLARFSCSAPRKPRRKWLCDYSKKNNGSTSLCSCVPPAAHTSKTGGDCSPTAGWLSYKLFLRACFPDIRLFSEVFLNWMRAMEMHYNAGTSTDTASTGKAKLKDLNVGFPFSIGQVNLEFV